MMTVEKAYWQRTVWKANNFSRRGDREVLNVLGHVGDTSLRNIGLSLRSVGVGVNLGRYSLLAVGNLVNSSDGTELSIEDSETDSEDLATLSPEEYFLSIGVFEECDDDDDLCIEETFESEWTETMTSLSTESFSAEDAAIAMGMDVENHEFAIRENEQAYQLKRDQQVIGQWPSRAALIADIGASRVLESWDTHWTEYEPAEKGELLNGLRLFLDVCPTTGGEIAISEETVESCCSSHEVIAAVCEETDERIFEHQMS